MVTGEAAEHSVIEVHVGSKRNSGMVSGFEISELSPCKMLLTASQQLQYVQ